MNCGIYCVEKYLESKNHPREYISGLLERYCQQTEVSLLEIKNILEEAGYTVTAYCDRWLKNDPCIIYDHIHHHFYLCYGKKGIYIYLSDVNYGDMKILRPYIFILRFKYYIKAT